MSAGRRSPAVPPQKNTSRRPAVVGWAAPSASVALHCCCTQPSVHSYADGLEGRYRHQPRLGFWPLQFGWKTRTIERSCRRSGESPATQLAPVLITTERGLSLTGVSFCTKPSILSPAWTCRQTVVNVLPSQQGRRAWLAPRPLARPARSCKVFVHVWLLVPIKSSETAHPFNQLPSPLLVGLHLLGVLNVSHEPTCFDVMPSEVVGRSMIWLRRRTL